MFSIFRHLDIYTILLNTEDRISIFGICLLFLKFSLNTKQNPDIPFCGKIKVYLWSC